MVTRGHVVRPVGRASDIRLEKGVGTFRFVVRPVGRASDIREQSRFVIETLVVRPVGRASDIRLGVMVFILFGRKARGPGV